jgi:hypothetical protein
MVAEEPNRAEVSARVEQGCVWLDAVSPGWRDGVTVAALKMKSECRCICGQTFAGLDLSGYRYAMGLAGAQDEEAWAIEHGFTIDYEVRRGTPETVAEAWRELEAAWYLALGVGIGRAGASR